MYSQLITRRHGFVRLRYEQLERRLLMAVADVEARQVVGLDLLAADPQYSDIDGRGYSVAILDHGIDLNHPYFGDDLVNNSTGQPGSDGVSDRIVHHWNFTSNPPGPTHEEVTSHGTHVTGIAAGFKTNVYSGVALGANIIAMQVLGTGTFGSHSDEIEAALTWIELNAAAYNIVAVNMSFSNDTLYTIPSTGSGLGWHDNFQRLVDNRQVIPIASVGNRYGYFDSQVGVGYPAADGYVLGVDATWDKSQDYRPEFYSHGTGVSACAGETWLYQYESQVDQVAPFSQRHAIMSDIFAPGADIFSSTIGGSSSGALGTTQAAPFVTGAVAIAQQLSMRERGVKLTLSQFRELVNSTGATIIDNNYDPNDFQLIPNNC